MFYGLFLSMGRPFMVRYPGGSIVSDSEIIDFYDQNPDLTLAALARITGKTIPELKKILMGAS